MRFMVRKHSDDVEVLLLPHKETGKFSFVNLTKGHICSCKFDSIKDAVRDMDDRKNKGLLDSYEVISKVPVVDAVPIVRCKDCIYRFTSLCPTHSVEYDMENEPDITWGIEEDDGFCSHGEAIK